MLATNTQRSESAVWLQRRAAFRRLTFDPELWEGCKMQHLRIGADPSLICKQATEAGELKEKHANFQPAEPKSQSSPQTIERYHGNSSRASQTGRVGRVGVGAYREVRRFKDETPASETQVQREKKGV